MRQFFLDLLNNLDKLAGLRQIEKIYASHSDPAEAKKEISQLINLLVSTSDQFAFIPEKEKQRLIRTAVITDPEFNSLNARIVFKWLNTHKDKYYKELAHMEKVEEENYEIVTGEKREEYLNQWLKALEPMQERINTTSVKAKREVQILGREREGRTDYTPLPEDVVLAKEKHLRYLRANYDAKTKAKLPEWMEEEKWNELND